jgi:ATP-dependent DNA ligase
MDLPIRPPILPMLAERVDDFPADGNWIFEPKWDGFRALIFRDGPEILIQSRDRKSLNRYFPELIPALLSQLPKRCVLDGEMVIARRSGLDFEALQLRIHPAASRVQMLSETDPASIVFFDLLAEGSRDLRNVEFQKRRHRLEQVLKNARPPLHLTPATETLTMAKDWFQRFEGAGLDGVMAKSVNSAYVPGKRVMLKIKHQRDCDCVVAGFRWHKDGEHTGVGSLLLGLFDDSGSLNHVGVCASFSAKMRKELLSFLRPYRRNATAYHPWKAESGADQRIPGTQSRWSQGKELSWEPLRPELVAEVAYDHMQGRRFRHVAQFRRWRPDKKPQDCTYTQLEVVPPHELAKIFAAKH